MKKITEFGPGMIGLASGGTLRTDDYIPSIMGLAKPPGTLFKKHTGLGPANPFNAIGQEFMKRPALQWLFLTNDDNLYPPDTLFRLLSHDKDVVTGLYLSRIQPFEPVLFDKYDLEPTGKNGEPERWYQRRFIKDGESGLIPIVACGDGCLLIKREVLETIAYPWWEYGLTLADACDHDMYFSAKVGLAGFEMWCDLDAPVDHVNQMTVRPYRNPGTGVWSVHLVQETRAIQVPMPEKDMKVGQ